MYQKQKYALLKNLQDCNILKPLKECSAIIAGGAIRSVFANEEISDYDIYFTCKKDLEKFIKIIEDEDKEDDFRKVSFTESAITYKFLHSYPKVVLQVIILPELMTIAENIIKQFDFTICMGAYDINKDEFILHDKFLEHLSRKELYYNIACKYPICSMYRVKKYLNKGYCISGIEMVKLALSINNLKMDNYKDLKKQLIGIDTMFLKDLTDVMMTSEYNNKKYEFEQFIDFLDDYFINKIDDLFDYQEDDD